MAVLAETVGKGWTYFQLWCVGLTTAILIWALRGRKRSRLRGATEWPLLGVLPSLLCHWDQFHDWITHLIIMNGGTTRFPGPWKSRILTADPANIEYLLKTRFHNYGKGEIYKELLRDMFGESILLQDGETFKRLSVPIIKAFSTPAFRDSVAAGMPAAMQKNLLHIFTHACEKGAIIDLQDVFHRLACHNAWFFGAGVELDCLQKVPFLKAFRVATHSVMIRMLMPTFCWKILRCFNVLFERRFLEAREFVYDFSLQQWNSHRGAKQDTSPLADLASTFLQYQEESGQLCSDKMITDLLVNLIFAGTDTITAGLTWFFWLVGKNPRVEGEILAELREMVKQRKSPEDQDPLSFSFEEVKRMEYLHAAISEALRLYPPIPIETTAPKENDVLPDGTPVEKGAQVIYSIYSLGRMENVWGKNCLEFKPERWMRNGKFGKESEFKFVVFNGGPRRCTGMDFAYWQMKWAAASILIRYSIKIVDNHPVLPNYGLVLFMKYGLLAMVHQREMADGDSSK